jgi:hypothetical protein
MAPVYIKTPIWRKAPGQTTVVAQRELCYNPFDPLPAGRSRAYPKGW